MQKPWEANKKHDLQGGSEGGAWRGLLSPPSQTYVKE